MKRYIFFCLLVFSTACVGAPEGAGGADSDVASADQALRGLANGFVFTETNDSAGNDILVFDRARDGSLSLSESVATGGQGDGQGLGSQGSVVLTKSGRWLLAVNAGSNDVSLFRVSPFGITLADVAPSGGDRPVSVTERHGLVYVLNAGADQSVSGFLIHPAGRLRPLPGSTRPLSESTPVGAAEVAFSPDGRTLVVTEKATNRIDTFPLRFGIPGDIVVTDSVGDTPFGFDFDRRGTLVVSVAASGGATSYRLEDGAPEVVSGPVSDNQAAACWVEIPRRGRFAYVTNTGSDNISTYTIDRDGNLALLDGDGALVPTSSAPIDMALAGHDRFLYAIGTGTISGFSVGKSGRLEPVSTTDGLPETSAGLAAN